MSGENPPSGPGPLAHPLLVEISRALEVLHERLSRLERAASPAPREVDAGDAAPDPDPRALGIIHELLSIPSAGLDPGELFALAMDRASRLLSADRAMLFVAERGGERLTPRSAHGFRREDLESTAIRPGEGLVGRVFKERRVLAYTIGDDAEAPDAFIERFPVSDAIAVPVRAEDDVTGVLYVGRRRLGAPFTANDVLLLLVIADRVGGGLVHQALLDRRTRHVARLDALRALAGSLRAGRPLAEFLAEACEAGRRLVDVRAAAVALEVSSGELEIATARGLPVTSEATGRLRPGQGLTADLYAGADLLSYRDAQSGATVDRSFLGDGGFHGCLLLPLMSRGSVAGVLYLADTEVRDFSTEEIAAARVLAALVASAIEGSRSAEALHTSHTAAVSERDREATLETARMLGEMAGGLARELNTAFAIILGKSRLLLARVHDEPLREGLETLEEAAWRGADIVYRLTALATPASGEPVELVDMLMLVEDVLAQTRPRWKDEAEARGVRIEIASELAPVPPVQASSAALREAVSNLMLNAVDAMPAGGQLHLVLGPRDGGAEFRLEDTGEGIPDEHRRRIFDPFFTTRGPQHLGLGLTIAHGVITRYGGRLEISSAPASGTRAVLWLPGVETSASTKWPQRAATAPIEIPPEPRAAERAPSPERPGLTPTSPRGPAPREDRPSQGAGAPVAAEAGSASPCSGGASVLVLEDDAPVRALLVESLSRAGYRVDSAADGASGLAKLEGGAFDVVLTDLALPERSGLAMARAVKQLSPRTPVVLITGWAHLLDPGRVRDHGVDLVLVKPFRIERVLTVVADALQLRCQS